MSSELFSLADIMQIRKALPQAHLPEVIGEDSEDSADAVVGALSRAAACALREGAGVTRSCVISFETVFCKQTTGVLCLVLSGYMPHGLSDVDCAVTVMHNCTMQVLPRRKTAMASKHTCQNAKSCTSRRQHRS